MKDILMHLQKITKKCKRITVAVMMGKYVAVNQKKSFFEITGMVMVEEEPASTEPCLGPCTKRSLHLFGASTFPPVKWECSCQNSRDWEGGRGWEAGTPIGPRAGVLGDRMLWPQAHKRCSRKHLLVEQMREGK